MPRPSGKKERYSVREGSLFLQAQLVPKTPKEDGDILTACDQVLLHALTYSGTGSVWYHCLRLSQGKDFSAYEASWV